MDGLVKIGRTNRDPKLRGKELSQSTGVPTPFTLVYQEYFTDCIMAEQYIHEKLNAYRVSNKREFFNLPVYEAIQAIQQLKEFNPTYSKSDEEYVLNYGNNEGSIDDNDLGQSIIEKGYNYLLGTYGMLEDHKQAFSLFKKAEKLGSPEAFFLLGYMYTKGFGCKKNLHTALDYYKKGAQAGFYDCYAEMAIIFNSVESMLNWNNASKCWDKYFSTIIDNGISPQHFKYFVNYIIELLVINKDIKNMPNKELFLSFQNEIINQFEIELDKVPDIECDDPYTLYHTIKNAKISFIQQLIEVN